MATYNAFAAPKKNYTSYNLTPSNTSMSTVVSNQNKPLSTTSPGTKVRYGSQTYTSQGDNVYKISAPAQNNQTTAGPFSTQFSSNNTAANDYLKRMQELAGQQTAGLNQQRADTESRINADIDRANNYYNSMIPTLQGRFDQYQSDANVTLEEMRQATDRSKASTRNQYLGAQRDALIAQRNNQAVLDQKHAALGTVDSSFYSKDNANLAAEANRYRQMNNMEMADALSAMDAELATAERQAQQAILQERNNLEDSIRQINFQLGNNESARQQALADVLSNYNNSVNAIESNLAGIEYNFAQQRQNFEQELANIANSSLSQEFMMSGTPQTEADYRYYVENAGNYAKLNPVSASKLSDKQIIAQNGLNAISQIQNYLTNIQGINSNPLNGVTDEGRNYQAAINNAADWIGRLRSGGAINQDESERFLELLPTFWDSQQVAQNKLNTLAGEFETVLGASGSALDLNQLNDILQTIGYL